MSDLKDLSQLEEVLSKMNDSERHLKIGLKRYYNHSKDGDVQEQRKKKAEDEKAICEAKAELHEARKKMYESINEEIEEDKRAAAAEAASSSAMRAKERLATGTLFTQ